MSAAARPNTIDPVSMTPARSVSTAPNPNAAAISSASVSWRCPKTACAAAEIA